MSDNIQKVSDSRRAIRDAATFLRYKAKCFFETGNTVMYEDLIEIALLIEESADKMYDAFAEQINTMFKQSEDVSMNLLHAAISGIIAGRETHDSE